MSGTPKLRDTAVCYTTSMVRRTAIVVLGLSLVGLGPVQLCVCALFSPRLVECETPKTQAHCDQMNMDEGGARLVAASGRLCCLVSKAPVPEAQFESPEPSLIVAPAAVSGSLANTPHVEHALPDLLVQDLSPPSLQSRLCTFLI
jgi:hypothetical protein